MVATRWLTASNLLTTAIGDAAWTILSLVLVAVLPMTDIGRVVVLIMAAGTAVFAILQFIGSRQVQQG
jgi:hypothetical protein